MLPASSKVTLRGSKSQGPKAEVKMKSPALTVFDIGTAWSIGKVFFIASIPSIAGPDRPDVDDLVPAHDVKGAVEIDGRIAMRGQELDGRAERGPALALEIERAMLVAHEAELGAGRPTAERDGLAAVRREGLPAGIHHDAPRLVGRHH